MTLPLRSRRFAALSLALVALLVTSPPATAQAPLVRISTGPNDQALPLVYADKGGLFAKAGLNVEISRRANTSTKRRQSRAARSTLLRAAVSAR